MEKRKGLGCTEQAESCHTCPRRPFGSCRRTGWKGRPAPISLHASPDGEPGCSLPAPVDTPLFTALLQLFLFRWLEGVGVKLAGLKLEAGDTFHQCAGHLCRGPNLRPPGVCKPGCPSPSQPFRFPYSCFPSVIPPRKEPAHQESRPPSPPEWSQMAPFLLTAT